MNAIEHLQPGDAEEHHLSQVQDQHGWLGFKFAVQVHAQFWRRYGIDLSDHHDDDLIVSGPVHPKIEHLNGT